jgi:hypothetical protein
MRELLTRLIDWFRRDRLEAELRDELRFHRTSLEPIAAADDRSPRDAGSATPRAPSRTHASAGNPVARSSQQMRYAVRPAIAGFAFGVMRRRWASAPMPPCSGSSID